MQLTAAEVARMCGVTESEVYRWVDRLDLPARRMNARCHIQPTELLEWASRNQVNVSPALFQRRKNSGPLDAALSRAIERGGVARLDGGADQTSILDEALRGLPLPNEFDRTELLSLLIARENFGGTSVGDGISIPHPHYPVVLPIAEPAARICYLDRPLELPSCDGKPIDVLILLVSPTVRRHLQLLAQVTHALRDATFRDAIRRRSAAEDLIAAARRFENAAASVVGEGTA